MGWRGLLTLLVGLEFTATSWAFHESGNVQCSGCHVSFSDSESPGTSEPLIRHPHMLKAETPSDVCLSCHATDNGSVFGFDAMNPAPEKGGGNFIYLTEDNLNDSDGDDGPSAWIPGEAAGHNLVAPQYGLRADLTLLTAPGGTFPSEIMGCTSCHDPHGNGNFRMLHGAGPVQDSVYSFAYPAPIAEGIDVRFDTESDQLHTAYKSGMSEWCANCHRDFHNTNYPSLMKHPTGTPLGTEIAGNYNAYSGSADPFGGAAGTAYLSLVPFEDDDPGNTITSTQGPGVAAKVMCLSCHRAHASSAPNAGRWDFSVTFLGDDGQRSGSHALRNPYGDGQRSLCNKCHVKDGETTIHRENLVISTD